jgi:peroxiredoxin Q/BCP
MPKLEPLLNQPAPDFTLLDQEGHRVTLSAFRGQHPVLLVFYPGDDTPGCTTQLCAIRDDWAEFQKYGVMAFGINHADAESHTKFWRHHGLKTPLLVDTDKQVSKLYGATKKFFKTEIIHRSVVLIDRAGIIRYLKRGMPSDVEILSAVKSL